MTVEKNWVVTLIGGFPEELIEKVYEVIGGADIVELLREAVDVEELVSIKRFDSSTGYAKRSFLTRKLRFFV